jgi:hypothetical protein
LQTDQQEKSTKLQIITTFSFMLLRAIGSNIVPIMSFLTALILVAIYGLNAITTEILFLVSPKIKENIICNSYYIHSVEGSHFVLRKQRITGPRK